MAEDQDAPRGLVSLGVVASLSNILSPIAAEALKGGKRVTRDFGAGVYKKAQASAATAAVAACGDLILTKGQVMLALSQKFPGYLGWLESVVRFFV